MSNLSQFTNKQNINLLWDVLLDELCINLNNKSLISNIRTVFESNIKPFTSRSNPKTPIMELNKQFLSQVVLAVNRLLPNLTNLQKQEQNIKRITITNDEAAEPYKIEDIQSSRQSEFEKEVEIKRMELENYMTPQKPKELDFTYGNLDGKITAMDSLIAEKLAQRNLDIEQLHNGNYNQTIDPEKWLTSKETSVKNEKNVPLSNQPINNRLKHINIDGDNISLNQDLNNNKNQKKVSFSDFSDENSSVNIFQKLKKQQPLEEIINTDIEQKQYIEQKSQPLPEIKQEQINRGIIVQNPSISPIIPKNEMIKQLNDMNTKIDTLYKMVFKLTNSIEELISDKTNNNSNDITNNDITNNDITNNDITNNDITNNEETN
jgi:hypothetical protein